MRALVLALCLALSGCAATPGCFVGVGLVGPMVICGYDLAPDEEELDAAELPNA